MPFLRFSRDKRGYEHTYLLHASAKKGGLARLLYWYRTPPGLKVGRRPFDEAMRRALEKQYPSVAFDWPKLMDTPVPPPDVEHWRERRRAEKAARQARQASERELPDADGEADGHDEERDSPDHGQDGDGAPAAGESTPYVEGAPTGPAEAALDGNTVSPAVDGVGRARKRRRRGGRRRGQGASMSVPPSAGTTESAVLSEGIREPLTRAASEEAQDAGAPDHAETADGSDSPE